MRVGLWFDLVGFLASAALFVWLLVSPAHQVAFASGLVDLSLRLGRDIGEPIARVGVALIGAVVRAMMRAVPAMH